MAFGIMLAMFPVGGPNPSPESMNYTVVVNMAVWGGCTVYYFVSARKWFTGPKTTVDEVEELVGRAADTQAAGEDGVGAEKKVAEGEGSDA